MNNKLWKIYFYILCGSTIILILIVPYFFNRDFIYGNFVFDLLARVFVTYSLYASIHTTIYLDETYEKIYKGGKNVSLDLHKGSNKILFLFFAIGCGITALFFYAIVISLFAPFITGLKFSIATLFAVLIEIPLIYRLYIGRIQEKYS